MTTNIKITEADQRRRPSMVKDRRWRNGRAIEMMVVNREAQGKSRLYFHHDGESILEGFGNRASRPWKIYRTFLEEVRAKFDLPEDVKFNWSRKAGCSCGCSPAFIITGHWGTDFFVTLSKDAPVAEDRELALARRVQLGDKTAYDELTTGQLSLKL